MAALVAFFPVLVNSVAGLGAVEPEAFDLMRSLSASPLQILLKVRIPNSLPYLLASLKIASSLAVVGAVIGEFTGATRGIGFLINTSSYYLETPLMFAGVLIISLAGIVFFGLVAYIEKRLVFWQVKS
jgi:NitT/TauT family transport system permease protein